MKNFYDILEINHDATQDDIKKSFRRLALKYHPDKAGEEFTEIFQKISEAYSILSNTKDKKVYDSLLKKYSANNIKIVNSDIHITLNISMEDSINGVDVPYEYKKKNGETGYIRLVFKSIQDGTILTYIGHGETENNNIKPGNLIITIKIKENNKFKILKNKTDLEVILYIDYLFAIVGGKKYIDSFIKDEILVFDVKPNILNGEIINSENKYGLIDKYGNRGNVIGVVKLIPPELSTQKYKALSYINSYVEPELMVYELCKNRN